MDISVVIPVFNEERFIERCYHSLLMCLAESGLTFEIIIIDNGSTDRTPDLLKRFGKAFVYRIYRTSVAQARNLGAEKSSGKIIAFIDGDVLVNTRWVESLRSFIKFSDECFVTGYEVLVREDPSWIEKYWFANLSSNHINSANLVLSRSAFDDLGGFDERLKTGEDYDLCVRAKRLQHVNYCPVSSFEAVHLGYPSTVSGFIKREMWHGEGDFYNLEVFLSSKVALLSLLYFLIQAIAIFLIFLGFYFYGAISVVVLFLINMAITIIRFRGKSIKTLLINSVINYIYFMARFLSLFQSLTKRKLSF